MIFEQSYRNHLSKNQRLLELFCAFDSSVTQSLGEDALAKAFSELVHKLTIIVSTHGIEVARSFLSALQASNEQEACALVTSFLEYGQFISNSVRELQQELLHFSRIVDLEGVSSASHKGIQIPSNINQKRMAKSTFIPPSLKVLIELVTVVMERRVSRGYPCGDLPFHHISNIQNEIYQDYTFSFPKEGAEYLLAIEHPRNRSRREVAYLFRNMLSYIGPRMALQMLAMAYLLKTGSLEQLRLELLIHHGVQWCVFQIHGNSAKDLYASAQQLVPRKLSVKESSLVTTTCNVVRAGEHLYVDLPNQQQLHLSRHTVSEVSINELIQSALGSVAKKIPEALMTMESGHLHLDRAPSQDQLIGIQIGKRICQLFQSRFGHGPRLTPMYDDDHVLVRTTPKQYQNYIRSVDSESQFDLIPESSPILRAICIALYNELIQKKLTDSVYYGGGNVYIRVDEAFTVELFEDFNGKCDLGCIFFESALLLYRSKIEEFEELFCQRFPELNNIHGQIDAIWNQTGKGHDERTKELLSFYQRFNQVCTLKSPDPLFIIQIINIVRGIDAAHINVLEDYYEVQQHKVRSFLYAMGINIRLYSLHFNRFTGRVVVNK